MFSGRLLPLLLIIALNVVVSHNGASANTFDYATISKEDADIIETIVAQYSIECSSLHDAASGVKVELKDDQVTRHRLLQDGSTLLVVEASFYCKDFGHPWSGSAGSPTYLIIKGKAYEIVRGSVSTFHVNESTTVINIWHHGSNCKSIEGDIISGSKPCFSAIYWDEVTETFSWFAGENIIKRLN